MKVRLGVVALVALVTVAGCSGSITGTGRTGGSATPPATNATQTDSGTGSVAPLPTAAASSSNSGGGTSAAFCAKLEQAQTKLSDLGTSLSGPNAKDMFDEEAAVFRDLEKSAPAEIKPVIGDLATVIATAAKYLQNPTAGSGLPTALQDLATKLPDDLQKLSAYVAANCS